MIYIALEDMDMDWSSEDVEQFISLWDKGISISSIAEHFNRDSDEVAILVIDQARKERIAPREGLGSDAKLAKIRKKRGRKVGGDRV